MNILIVDDDPISLNKMEAILEVLGNCRKASNGKTAVEMFQEALAQEKPFDLVTLDVEMPDLNGTEVLLIIRKLEMERKILPTSRARVIMVSGRSDKESLLTCMETGCDSFIVKPFTITTLIEKLDQIEFRYDKKAVTAHNTEPILTVENQNAPPKNAAISNPGMRILIVDDDNVSRQKMEVIMEEYGTCKAARGGKEAVALFLEAHGKKRPFHLITLDYSMPDLSGVEALSTIRKFEAKENMTSDEASKIIMVTSHSDKEDVIACLKAGCNEYIVKPFNQETVCQRLTKMNMISKESEESAL